MLAATSVKVGAQNMHWADAGAWTGEISPLMLRDCNLDLVELAIPSGASSSTKPTRPSVWKTEAAIRHGPTPLICIGETLAQRQEGRAAEVLAAQVRGALGKLEGAQKSAPILWPMSRSGPSA